MVLDYAEERATSVRQDLGSKTPRILVLRAGAIGDTLMVTPLVRALRQTFPEAYLVFLCSRSAYDVIRYNPHLDEVIPISYRHLPFWLSAEKLRILRRLRALNLDWGLALESHPSFLQMMRWAGAAHMIGYGVLPGIDSFERASFDPQRHSIENHLNAARPLGVRPTERCMELHYPAALDDLLRQRLSLLGIQENDLLIGVHPGWGGRKHPIDQTRLRSWPPERFAQVIQYLVEEAGAAVVLTGSAADRPLTEFIARLASVPCVNLAGELSLLEHAALIGRLDLYLTVDSGPAHMAAALGIPLVTLWGPGIFEQTAPVAGRGSVRVLYHRVPCAPCYGTPLMKICQDNICMKEIEVAEVQSAIEEVVVALERKNPRVMRARSGPRPPA